MGTVKLYDVLKTTKRAIINSAYIVTEFIILKLVTVFWLSHFFSASSFFSSLCLTVSCPLSCVFNEGE
jgi:hypothetical protein